MADCIDYDYYDEECYIIKVVGRNRDSLKDLMFSKYDLDLEEETIVPILNGFNQYELSFYRQQPGNSYKILYNNCPLFVRIPGFCGRNKCRAHFQRNRYVKTKNLLFLHLFLDIMMTIDCKTCEMDESSNFLLNIASYNWTAQEPVYLSLSCRCFFDKVVINAMHSLYYTDCKIVKCKAFS